jgi:hypothetical protein
MNMTATDDLVSICPPPFRPAPDVNWEEVEAAVGGPLPSDYKWLVEHYGLGRFDRFVFIFQPGTAVPGAELQYEQAQSSWGLNYLREAGEDLPYAPEELAIAGATDNGDCIYWLRSSEDPDQWPIVVNEARGPKWDRYEGGIVEFIVAVLTRAISVSMFPEMFFAGVPEFTPVEEPNTLPGRIA